MLAVLGSGVSLVFGALMYLAHRDALAEALAGLSLPASARPDATLLALMAAITVLMAIALALFGLLVTHRVAGPVYVMSHYVHVLSRGRYPIMRPLRRGDELKDFFDSFQRAIEALREREIEEAELIDQAVARFEALAQTPETQESLEALRQLNIKKRDATDRVDIGGGAGEKSAA